MLLILFGNTLLWGAWVAQLVKRPTSAQVMNSRFMSSSPALGSVLTAQNLEPALDSVSLSLSAPPSFMLYVSLLFSKKKKKINILLILNIKKLKNV